MPCVSSVQGSCQFMSVHFRGSYLQNVRRQVHETMRIIPFLSHKYWKFRRSIRGISVESPEPQGKHIAQSSDVLVLTDFFVFDSFIVKRIKDRNTSILEGIF